MIIGMAVRPQPHRFTVDEYYQMGEAGIFHEDDRVELIEGEIIEMVPIGVEHAACVNRLNRYLVERAGRQAVVLTQNPVRLSNFTEPQPDFALAKAKEDFYASGHPGPEDLMLIVEVSDTSLKYDRDVKAALYARMGIPELWIVDIRKRRVEVFRSPRPTGYADRQTVEEDDELAPAALPILKIGVKEILG